MPLADILLEKKAGLVESWFEKTLQVFSPVSANSLLRRPDQFQNPVGSGLKKSLATLLNGLLQPEKEKEAVHNALQEIIRILAVQNISASRAVGFLFELKRIVRAALPDAFSPDECAAFEMRIDEFALAAFDLFVEFREKIYDLKVNESKRMNFVDQRKAAASLPHPQ
jgi:hypothetical protein